MNRRSMLKAFAAAPLAPAVAALATERRGALAEGTALVFDPAAYTEETTTVSTATEAGDVTVTYRAYTGIPYVANPVDAAYQSLNVSVPVKLGETAVDASGAPILLDIGVGGYLSSTPGGGGAPGGAPAGAQPAGTPPAGMDGVPSGSGAMMGGGQAVSNADLALAAGYVVVSPGVRGRDNVAADGTYYGKAPAAIVDLKAAVRYVRANTGAGRLPGNADWIVSTGSSAGGALSALLGAAADDPRYDAELAALGAADASDAILASAAYCPITDLEHADMAYEWLFGDLPAGSGVVDQAVSGELRAAFAPYQASLELVARDGSGPITADTMGDHLLRTFLQPAATAYLAALSDADRASYLAANPWIDWTNGAASFGFADFLTHLGGRKKGVPAFDALDLSAAENILFGNATTDARHFTLASLRRAAGDAAAELDADLPATIALMNPMGFVLAGNPARAKRWWIRVGTSDTDTAPTVVANLAAGLAQLGDVVDARMYWDAGHGANEDAPAFIRWIAQQTGYGA